ncbi:gas vesicle protein [Streptomyces sp. Ru73]|uniref:GvpL/GvpF family gas vesicle protein n=1 Tax=Streptomyces sp. Ru73 TaxID=2080748 RepID=UPI000CDE3C22|nr:GvpL/GvpF family gas vesicle protein [Streptomyces sp. Ru73]POX39335.1 gas vesicle protein [Streptomyces sp. Ru73]
MATYVYGIAHADHPDPEQQVLGIGDPPRPVRIVRAGELAAVVSDCPEDLRPKRRDLLAHQHVLTETGSAGAVLPLRFGSLSADDDAVLGALGEHTEHYKAQLAELTGRVEFNVKAAHREEAVLRLVVDDEPEVRRLTEALQSAGGGSYPERVRLGELVANGVRAREVRDAHTIEQTLAPLAERSAPGPEGSGWLVNLSFLLPREDSASFTEAAHRLAEAEPHLELLVNGPLPPYSFVRTVHAAMDGQADGQTGGRAGERPHEKSVQG